MTARFLFSLLFFIFGFSVQSHAAPLNPRFDILPTSSSPSEIILFSALEDLFSKDPIVQYQWNFGDNTSAFGILVLHSYKAAGTFTVTLTVKDIRGKTATTSKTISIQNRQPPSPVLAISPKTNSHGLIEYKFDGTGSTDPNGRILFYLWNFGDGSLAQGATVSHIYRKLGTYQVKLTVTDIRGISATGTRTLTVTGTSPIAIIGANPQSGPAPLTVRFSSGNSKVFNGKIKSREPGPDLRPLGTSVVQCHGLSFCSSSNSQGVFIPIAV